MVLDDYGLSDNLSGVSSASRPQVTETAENETLGKAGNTVFASVTS